MVQIKSIKISKLFGDKNYNIKLKDNKLILVAENGAGKTTIVNIIYYFISRQWTKLLKYDFKSVEVKFSGNSIKLERSEIDIINSDKISRLLRRYSPSVKERFYELLRNYDISELAGNYTKLEYLADELRLPKSLIIEISRYAEREQINLFESKLREKEQLLTSLMDTQILYLPTYRRIEQDLNDILPDLKEELSSYRKRKLRYVRNEPDIGYVELVEFGMEDVVEKVNRKLSDLKEDFNSKLKTNLTGGYLRDVINKNYSKITYNQIESLTPNSLRRIFDRIDEDVLSKNEKEKLYIFISDLRKGKTIEKEENKILAYFIFKLSAIYSELEKNEKEITQFIQVCNEYSTNKIFLYDYVNFQILIRPLKQGDVLFNKPIEFKNLSSGEKQIVSLFSHIYLSNLENYIIIIDEPELSLSVTWQKRFLADIAKNEKCLGLISVTHSPFIFQNELENYARGLNEFEINS
ncbi:AAA family ATPase [Christiangramia sp. OXR-203]|uniref:AAA family ATPase n=1 Tax=Christiangramia sp. OXR-203 TaxID=3100176 RepID=UPI002AC966D4|nr:AAA family ATPase [Christiangramia sp. OXR-203]WPY97638.1 AAA family ATPase [Christiangramia sp. OXR-203]